MNGSRHAAFVYAANCIHVCSGLLQMVKIVQNFLWYVIEIEENELEKERSGTWAQYV